MFQNGTIIRKIYKASLFEPKGYISKCVWPRLTHLNIFQLLSLQFLDKTPNADIKV